MYKISFRICIILLQPRPAEDFANLCRAFFASNSRKITNISKKCCASITTVCCKQHVLYLLTYFKAMVTI